jgi:hypothetical protein
MLLNLNRSSLRPQRGEIIPPEAGKNTLLCELRTFCSNRIGLRAEPTLGPDLQCGRRTPCGDSLSSEDRGSESPSYIQPPPWPFPLGTRRSMLHAFSPSLTCSQLVHQYNMQTGNGSPSFVIRHHMIRPTHPCRRKLNGVGSSQPVAGPNPDRLVGDSQIQGMNAE